MSKQHAQRTSDADGSGPPAETVADHRGSQVIAGGVIPEVLAEPGSDLAGGDGGSSLSDQAYGNTRGKRPLRPHDMQLGKDFDGAGGGNVIKNAFWKARYDGSIELADAARHEMERRVRTADDSVAKSDEAIAYWTGELMNLLWDLKKLHDNDKGAGKRRYVDVGKFHQMLGLFPGNLLWSDEKSFILGGFDALVNKGAGKRVAVPRPDEIEEPEPVAAGGGAVTSAAAEPAPAAPQLSGDPVALDYIADGNDAAMRMDRFITFGEIVGGSIHDLVEGVIAGSMGHPIGSLSITGHGMAGYQTVGDHAAIKVGMSPEDRRDLARLRPYFAPGAEVVLHGCEVGAGQQGEKLLRELSSMWGVRVRAGVPYQRVTPWIEGTETIAETDAQGCTTVRTEESSFNEMSRDDTSPSSDDELAATWDKRPEASWTSMPVAARYRAVITWLGGYTNEHEGALIVKMFATARPADRRELYRQVEGHPWTGDFRSGWFTDDDGLFNSLTAAQLEQLKALLN